MIRVNTTRRTCLQKRVRTNRCAFAHVDRSCHVHERIHDSTIVGDRAARGFCQNSNAFLVIPTFFTAAHCVMHHKSVLKHHCLGPINFYLQSFFIFLSFYVTFIADSCDPSFCILPSHFSAMILLRRSLVVLISLSLTHPVQQFTSKNQRS